MEIIRISGYTENEKLNIASKYLLPKQLLDNGIKGKEVKVAETAIESIIKILHKRIWREIT